MSNVKYILITGGGGVSGVDMTVIASSIGAALKSYSIEVSSIKINPYMNFDSGRLSPDEHGNNNYHV